MPTDEEHKDTEHGGQKTQGNTAGLPPHETTRLTHKEAPKVWRRMFEGNPHAGAIPMKHSGEHYLQIQGAS